MGSSLYTSSLISYPLNHHTHAIVFKLVCVPCDNAPITLLNKHCGWTLGKRAAWLPEWKQPAVTTASLELSDNNKETLKETVEEDVTTSVRPKHKSKERNSLCQGAGRPEFIPEEGDKKDSGRLRVR